MCIVYFSFDLPPLPVSEEGYCLSLNVYNPNGAFKVVMAQQTMYSNAGEEQAEWRSVLVPVPGSGQPIQVSNLNKFPN